jgi:hypothetical protein
MRIATNKLRGALHCAQHDPYLSNCDLAKKPDGKMAVGSDFAGKRKGLGTQRSTPVPRP